MAERRSSDKLRARSSPDDAKRKRESGDRRRGLAASGSSSGGAESSAFLDLALIESDGDDDDNGNMRDKKRKWTRLLLRELYDLGYNASAAALEQEAHVQLRSEAMKQLQKCVEAREWDHALRLIGHEGEVPPVSAATVVVQMRSPQAAREASLLLLKRKFLDLLVQKQLRAALSTLHHEILPVFHMNEADAKDLALLLLCREERELESIVTIPWREHEMLARIEQLASPDEIIPRGALGRLVQSGADADAENNSMLAAYGAPVTGECVSVLLKHSSDVLDLKFSPNGALMASSSRDGAIIIWKLAFGNSPEDSPSKNRLKPKVLHVFQCANGAGECLAWSPNSQQLLSCGSESSTIQQWNISTGKCQHEFHHPADGVTSVQWTPSGRQFLSGSAEKSLLLWNTVDGSMVYQWGGRRILDIAVHPDGKRVFVLISGVEIRVYDLASKSDELFFKAEVLISCISLSPLGTYLLVNFIQDEEIACLEIDAELIVAKYSGLKEQRYVTRPCFSGGHSEIIASGSEDARIYLWYRDTGELVATLQGHSSVINTVQCHPVHTDVIASTSDDETIRVWMLNDCY